MGDLECHWFSCMTLVKVFLLPDPSCPHLSHVEVTQSTEFLVGFNKINLKSASILSRSAFCISKTGTPATNAWDSQSVTGYTACIWRLWEGRILNFCSQKVLYIKTIFLYIKQLRLIWKSIWQFVDVSYHPEIPLLIRWMDPDAHQETCTQCS